MSRAGDLFRWAAERKKQMTTRQPGIPGTRKALDAEVQSVLLNQALTPEERGHVAAGLITAKVLQAHRITS